MKLRSQLFQGYARKHNITDDFIQCNSCSSLFDTDVNYCPECESIMHRSTSIHTTIEAADCSNCDQPIPYTRENRVNTNYNIFGYICDSCQNILELKFDEVFYEPSSFLKNDLGSSIEVTLADSNKKETIVWMFSLQTKVNDIGFFSYQPDDYTVWLASINNTYCGYVALNDDDELNQIWVDEGYRRSGIATKLVEFVCSSVLDQQAELVITSPTDSGREFFDSIQQDGRVFGKDLIVSY